MYDVRESTILNTPDGTYTAHAVGEAQVRIYRDGEEGPWNVKVHYDETRKPAAFDICEDIDRALEEAYGEVLGVDSIDFNQQLEDAFSADWSESKVGPGTAELYEVGDGSTNLNFRRYHRARAEIGERDLNDEFPGMGERSYITGIAPRLGSAGLVGGEALLNVVPHLPNEAALAGAGLGLLFVGEPVLNAKTNLPTPSRVLSQRVVNRVNRRYTMENDDLEAALSRRYTPEGETRWSWDEYEQHGTFDGRNLEEVWDITRSLDFENIEEQEGVTFTTHRDTYSDAVSLVSAVTGRDLEISEDEQPMIQREAMDRAD